jgi:hypothetical protein
LVRTAPSRWPECDVTTFHPSERTRADL